MQVKIKFLSPLAKLPTYATNGSGCFDISAVGSYVLSPHESCVIHTGLSFEVPEGNVLLMFSRSGSSFKHDVRLGNCVGVIDSDYRGELKVNLFNDSIEPMHVQDGSRIAQGMIIPYEQASFLVVNTLTNTERDTGGFGSTGD